MLPVLVVTHLEDRSSGLGRECLEAAGLTVRQADLVADDALPRADELAGIVAFGGNESATQAGEHPFLRSEVALLRAALEAEVPVLGICLGAQLLAVAAGGAVRPMGSMTATWARLSPEPAATADPLFAALPSGLAVLEWHEDMIETPPGAAVLATTPGPGTALFRVGGTAWGSQAHLEVDPALLLDHWLAEPDGAAQIASAGRDIEEFRGESRRRLEAQMPAGREVFARFAETVRAGVRRSAAARPRASRRG